MRLLNRFAESPWVGAALVLLLVWANLQAHRPASAQAFVYHTATVDDNRYSWARENGEISMRVESTPYFWRYNCPKVVGDPLKVFIVDSAGQNWYDLVYPAGALLPSQVFAVGRTGLYHDYSAYAEKYKLPEEMKLICPRGW